MTYHVEGLHGCELRWPLRCLEGTECGSKAVSTAAVEARKFVAALKAEVKDKGTLGDAR